VEVCEMKNAIIFSGSGGQGVMSMGIMLTQAAVENGQHAIYMPSYGPEQRGGSAKCTVIIDQEEIVSPMAGSSGVLVAMNNMAYQKFISELEPGGTLIYDSTMLTVPIERDDIKKVPVPAADIALEVGSSKTANIIVIGTLIGMTGIISPEDFQKSLDRKFARKGEAVCALNRKAFQRGLELGKLG